MTDSRTATSVHAIEDGYFAMWNETDAEHRRAVIAPA
jgi:hypothetical protein